MIRGEDQRLLLVIGPCSSDNEDAVLDYAHRLSKLQDEVSIPLSSCVSIQLKPRTNGEGYKGLMHQPDTSKLPDLINGIAAVRHLHYRVITETGLTTADEMLYSANYPFGRRFGILSCHRSSLRRRPRTPFRCFWNRYAYRHEKPDFRQFDCHHMGE